MKRLATVVLGAAGACVMTAGALTYYVRHAADGFSARAQPTRFEAVLAGAALRLATPDAMRQRTNPFTPTSEALQTGMEHFADHCAQCHANNGSGQTMLGAGMYPKPPDMRLPATQRKTDGELFGIIENGIRLSGMPAFGGSGGTADESWNLVVFLRHLPALSASEQEEMERMNPKGPSERDEEKQEDDFLNGMETRGGMNTHGGTARP